MQAEFLCSPSLSAFSFCCNQRVAIAAQHPNHLHLFLNSQPQTPNQRTFSSVIEWITAMGLVWPYGEVPRNKSRKGLSWGMVPLLGEAFCACMQHFFYNSESLEVLVALQAALTVLVNVTMCLAAFRTYRSSEELSKNM